MLHLESGVDFDEVVFAVFVHQEFHGAGVLVAHLQHNTAQTEISSLLANAAGKSGGLNTEVVLAHLNEPWKTKHFLPALITVTAGNVEGFMHYLNRRIVFL